ncbi:glycoside hydrolase family 3 C-terminal domain-containing protein [uncultured Microbacterium sp.]|uniref:Exo-alpha-(1->6)-L-arabinopyranosidase n=1 Tax=uncultured Microbacterium sp. TaxID=191216 RepID=A0A1Y5P0J3_9MICO|nr:glycoside hydrolase family 3 N-terminal domain-containing protein [uncultured Microbacterium sp.]SBS72186.1 Thermostable beta-glucosidase B [uncultured Microbacterium sp.]
MNTDIDTGADDLTLEQQAGLGSGADFWTTKATGNVPSILMTDGPHGLRKQPGPSDHLALSGSLPATCFPPAVALSQTWDRSLVRRIGEALGRESQAAGVQVLLGPGINIKRDPRGGRNFEYFSEDPLVAGVLGSAWVDGLQSTGVGASLKHFAVNSQEHDRMRVSAEVSPRPLREIYLRAFQRVVRDSQPWTVMSSYNRINGVHASQNRWLLTDLLRGEWGFDGVVVSDWGAVADRVAAVAAGLDLQMPANEGFDDAKVVRAVLDGHLDSEVVAEAARRVSRLAHKAHDARRPDVEWDADEHHRLAREVAARAVVLLRDDARLLPLAPGEKLAIIGRFASEPRFQGGGSSHVNASRVDIPLDEIRELAGDAEVEYAPGFDASGDDGDALRADAVEVAARAGVAIVYLGLFESQETEGADRADIELPADQVELLRAITRVQPRTVVVLSHGGVLRLAPVVDTGAAIVDGSLLGQAAGGAVADVLFGVVNPSGKISETVPVRIEDTPAFTNFPGDRQRVRHGEGIHVGYRWYDAREIDVTFPFGHGLSYTAFEYDALRTDASDASVTVRVVVRNIGERAGREIVQVYASRAESIVTRAPQWLVGFDVVDLEPGESREVEIDVPLHELEYWDEDLDRWVLESGVFGVRVGSSSRDIRMTDTIDVAGEVPRYLLDSDSSIGEILRDPVAGPALSTLFEAVFAQFSDDSETDFAPMLDSLPFGRFLGTMGAALPEGLVEEALAEANARNGFA